MHVSRTALFLKALFHTSVAVIKVQLESLDLMKLFLDDEQSSSEAYLHGRCTAPAPPLVLSTAARAVEHHQPIPCPRFYALPSFCG